MLLFGEWPIGSIKITESPIIPKEEESFVIAYFGFGSIMLAAIIYAIDMRIYNNSLFEHYLKQARLANEYKLITKNSSNQEIKTRADSINCPINYQKECLYKIRSSECCKALQVLAKENQKGDKEHIIQLEGESNAIYPNFTQLLCSHFPNITEKKLNLCILMKAQFSTKDIATLLCMHHSSISHLKKRMFDELNNTNSDITNLADFINNI